MAAPKLPSVEQMAEIDRATLIAHRADVDRAIRDSEVRAKRDAKAQIEEIARNAGFAVADLFGGGGDTGGIRTRKSSPSEPKYRHPENADVTWTGRGRKPSWVTAHLDGGGSIDDLSI